MSKPYVSIMTPCGNGSAPFGVCITKKNDDTWTKDVIELAEFDSKEAAEAFRDGLANLLKVFKPKRIGTQI